MNGRGRRTPGAGYTLVELLAVLAILGVLALMAWPLARIEGERAREAGLRRALWQIRDAIDAYHAARVSGAIAPPPQASASDAGYPPDLEALVRAYPDARPDHRGQSLRFLRELPRDPFADPLLPASRTWATRSLASEADRPRPGEDVFDVHSMDPGQSLDGRSLARW